jgi:ABC-type nitrate/sulfonate/bicarbonate transport system permease component
MRCKLLLLATLLAGWQIVASAIGNPKLFPGVIYIATVSFPSLANFGGSEGWSGALSVVVYHSAITLARIAVALPIGMAAGTLLALSVYFFRSVRTGSATVVRVIQAVPLFALIPLFLQWFGGDEKGVILYIAVAVGVVASGNAYIAVRNLRPEYAFQARLNGASRLKVFTTVYLAGIQPEMVASFRTALSFSWAFSLGAEYLTSGSGLGSLVYQSYLYSDSGKLIVLGVVYGLYGILLQFVSEPLLLRLRRGRSRADRFHAEVRANMQRMSGMS